MKRRIIGGIFLAASLILLSAGIGGITGNVIKDYIDEKFLFIHLIGFIFLLVSILIFAGRKSLDAIIIPTGGGEWYTKKKYILRIKTGQKKP